MAGGSNGSQRAAHVVSLSVVLALAVVALFEVRFEAYCGLIGLRAGRLNYAAANVA
jgi:hypothetical protein